MPRPVLTRTASAGADYNHPAGGFVCIITEATENPLEEYVSIGYDIAEGPHAGHYEYSNEFRRYYSEPKDPSWGNALAKFLTALEEANEAFDMDEWQKAWDCSKLRGLVFGAVFRERQYTDSKGNDRTKPQFVYACSPESIKEGRFKVPEPVDARETIGRGASVSAYDPEPVPFSIPF